MSSGESVIFLMPESLRELRRAAELFACQYHCVTLIQVRGSLLREGNKPCRADSWLTVAQLDEDLDLLGLGSVNEQDEGKLLWVRATASTQVRLSSRCDSHSLEAMPDEW